LNLKQASHNDLFGGNTVEEAANIFDNIIRGNGSEFQNNVVISNAAMGLKCLYADKSLENCLDIAKESLLSKKALGALKKLIDLQS
jgi:anthranilate phosphoribosyltransferase